MAGVVPDEPMGRAPSAEALAKMGQGSIFVVKAAIPGYRFEWHAASEIVFVIREGVLTTDRKEMAEPFAWGVKNSGQAWNATLIWLRGHGHAQLAAHTSVAEHKEKSSYAELG